LASLPPTEQRIAYARAVRRAKRSGDPADRAEADRILAEYRANQLADDIKRVVDGFPPLTQAQRDRLAVLLRGDDDLRQRPDVYPPARGGASG
jgi:hypothetical protein